MSPKHSKAGSKLPSELASGLSMFAKPDYSHDLSEVFKVDTPPAEMPPTFQRITEADELPDAINMFSLERSKSKEVIV